MSELDVEKLKRYISKPERTHADELWLEEQLPAIIAAWEDRDRLREALKQILYSNKFGPQPNVWAESLRQIARAALEGHDG